MDDDHHLEAIALLQDPARRALYEYVVEQGREVSRNEAAAAVGLQRTLAAFHLDRLADAGLLEVSFRRLGARSGPGAGRPAKLYRRAAVEHAVSLPPRAYLRAATLLAAEIEGSGAEAVLAETARAQGVLAGQALAQAAAAEAAAGVDLEQMLRHLAEQGYEPAVVATAGAAASGAGATKATTGATNATAGATNATAGAADATAGAADATAAEQTAAATDAPATVTRPANATARVTGATTAGADRRAAGPDRPAMAPTVVRLRNCPFHALAAAFPVVACGMNVALLEGLIDGAHLDGRYTVRVDPQPGTCCAIVCSKINES